MRAAWTELQGSGAIHVGWQANSQHGRRLVYQPGAIIRHHNIGTLQRLLRQAFQHGYYGVALHRKHAAFLRPFGYRRFSSYRLRLVLGCLRDYLSSRSPESGCALTFQSGLLLGKAAASARLRYLDL